MTKLTLVQQIKTPSHHYYLRFGCPVETIIRQDRTKMFTFKPGQIFGYVRWCRNDYGTSSWQFYICQAVQSGRVCPVPGVRPGADVLSRARGKAAVQRLLAHLKSVEKSGVKLENIPASFWRKAQNMTAIRASFPKLSPLSETL